MAVKQKSKTKSFFKDLDFFSVTYNFRIGKRIQYSSVCGGIGFSIFTFLIISYILKSFIDYMKNEDYKIVYLEKTSPDSQIIIDSDSFFFALEFLYLDNRNNQTELNVYDNKEFTNVFILRTTYLNLNEDEIIEKIIMENKNCTLENIRKFDTSPNQNLNYYNNQQVSFIRDFSDLICFDIKNVTLKGQSFQKNFSHISIDFMINETYYLANRKKVQHILENYSFKIVLYNSDNYINLDKFSQDFGTRIRKRIQSSITTYLDFNYKFIYEVYFQELEVQEDKNLFFQDYFLIHDIRFSQFTLRNRPFFNRVENFEKFKNYDLLTFRLRVDFKKNEINISYKKIPEFLSGVSVIATNSLIICKIIFQYLNFFYSKKKIFRKILKDNETIIKIHKQEIDSLYSSLNFQNSFISNNTCLNGKSDRTIPNHQNSKNNNFSERDKYIPSLNINSTLQGNRLSFSRNNNNTSNIIDEDDYDFYKNENFIYEKSKNNIKNNDKNLSIINDNKEIYDINLSKTNNKIMENDRANIDIHPNSSIIYNFKDEKYLHLNQNYCNIRPYNIFNNPIINVMNIKNDSKDKIIFPQQIPNFNKALNLELKQNINFNNDKSISPLYSTNRNSINKPQEEPRDKKCNSKNHTANTDITTFDLIKSYIFCCKKVKEKKKLLKLSEKKFYNSLDIISYLKKMFELDILKYLLLDADLLQLLNFVSRPTISGTKNDKDKIDQIEEFFNVSENRLEKNYLNFEKLKIAYDKITHDDKKQNGRIKKKMIELFNNQISELIKAS